MFRFTLALLLIELLLATAQEDDQNSLADVKSDGEAFQENLIEDLLRNEGQEFKRYLQKTQCKDGCSKDIRHSLDKVSSEIEDLRAKLGEQCQWSSVQPDTCPPGFTYFPSAGKCYKAVFESHDWYSAGKKCHEFHRGSHLAAITTATENTAVKTFLASELSKNISTTTCIPREHPGLESVFWTSGQRLIEDDCTTPFVWKLSIDKQLPLQFTNWEGSNPSCSYNAEFCLHVYPKLGFQWNDIRCTRKMCPLCEYSP